MSQRTARRVVLGLWIATAALWLGTVVLLLVDRPSDVVFALLLAIPSTIYGVIGGLVARRRPENPIGWVFAAVGVSLSLWLFGLSYAQAGLEGLPGLGTVPGAAVAAWIGVLVPLVLPTAMPTFLLYFPDGHLRSRRWRPAIWATVAGGVLMLVGGIGTVRDFSGTIPLSTPRLIGEIPSIGGFWATGLALVFAASFAGLVTLVLRFRSAPEDERQSLRLLVAMIVAMAVVTALALVASLAMSTADWLWLVIVLAILVVGFGFLVGIPLATAAAVLTYGLYDVGIVMKKTVVYVVLVIVFLILLGLVALMLAPLAFIGTDSAGEAGRQETISRFVAMFAVLGLLLSLLFRPVKRLARRMVYGRRSTRYEAMAEFSDRLGDAYSTADVLPRMAEIVRASTGAEVARVWLQLGDELRPIAAAPSGAPRAHSYDGSRDELPEMVGVRAFPVRDRGELLGALSVAMPAAEPLSKDGERLLIDLASQAGLVLRNVRLIEELQESRRRIVAAQDERARKLERDLHDGAQQQLVALSVKLGLAEQLATRDPEKARAVIAEAKADATDALDTLRDLARGIYPPVLADKGLGAALEAQARKSPVDVRIEGDGARRYPQEIEAAVYFCALEALQNMAKYANATSATITLAGPDGILSFEVADDGAGFDPAHAHGSGLTNMRDRLEALGGTLEVTSSPGAGTTISGRIPVRETA